MEGNVGRHLYSIEKKSGYRKRIHNNVYDYNKIMCHTGLNGNLYFFFFKKALCSHCNVEEAVEHII